MDRSFQYPAWLSLVKALPDDLVRSRPVLSVGYAWGLLTGGEPESAEERLRDAERWLDTAADTSDRPEAPSVEMVVVDEKEFRSLPATIASARAYQAGALGDVAGGVKHARQALDLLPEGEYFERAVAAIFLGSAYWTGGDLEAAHRTFTDGISGLQKADNILFRIGASHLLAEIRMAQGRLNEAVNTIQQALQLAMEQGEPVPQGTEDLYRGLSWLDRERDDLAAAAQHLLTSQELREQAASQGDESRWCVAMARLKEAQGNRDGALDLLRKAERLYIRSPMPDLRPIAALKARIRIAQGRLSDALSWVGERGLSVDDDLSYVREFEHLTLTRVLIAQYGIDRADRYIHDATALLGRLLKAAEEGERTGSVIEILVQQALAHEARGDIPSALVPLERALTLAEPEGYIRIFADEGEPMRVLLRHAAAGGIASSYTQRLLSAFEKPGRPASTRDQAATAELPESLTGREVEILRLVAAGMRNQEIADQLFISLATVKRHITNIHGKLGVSHRTEAIARAGELNLL